MLTGHLPELVLVLTLALIVFGPKRLPEIGSSLGKSIRDFRQGLARLDGEVTQPPAVVAEAEAISPSHAEQKAG
jgi:sec-independent protein translocase protein TatA